MTMSGPLRRGLLAVIVAASAAFGATVASAADVPMTPSTNEGEKWRIGYYEGGEYINYKKVLTETVRGLMRLGWVETVELPKYEREETAHLWNWMTKNLESEYLEFVVDAHYSARWDDATRAPMAQRINERLAQERDLDLIIAMGTWAGKDLANDDHSTPTLVLSTSDPVAAGIIVSPEDSGRPHVHAFVDPSVYERQVRIFHEIIGFRRLGIAYEDSVSGRSYAALDSVKEVARARGFDIVPCYTRSDIADMAEAGQSVVRCFEKFRGDVDAIYVTEQGGVNSDSIARLVDIANDAKLPTFSQAGEGEVEQGFLVSISHAGYRYVGEFHAQTMARVLNGAVPNELDQIFEQPPKIAINLSTAERIGFDPPVVILGAADEIFHEH